MGKKQSRDPIPASLRRQIRTEAGFGCVFCGMPIIEYHHIIPHAIVQKHEAENLVALCGNHHNSFHNKLIPEKEVYFRKQNPFNLTQDDVKGNFWLGSYESLKLVLGSCTFIDTPKIFVVNDFPLIEIKKDECGRPLLNVKFFDEKDVLIAEIVDNEWIVKRKTDKVWDLQWSQGELKINSASRKIHLTFVVDAIKNTVELKANLYYKNVLIKINSKSIEATLNGKDAIKDKGSLMVFRGMTVESCGAGIGIEVQT